MNLFLFLLLFFTIYYLIVSVARMSSNLINFITQVFFFIFSGDDYRFNQMIRVVDTITLELYAWTELCCTFAFLQILYLISSFIFILRGVFKYFCGWEPPDISTNHWSQRIFQQNFCSKDLMSMMAVDQRCVVLVGLVLHSYISYLFLSTTKWSVYVSGLI